jgi:hypothetical protein
MPRPQTRLDPPSPSQQLLDQLRALVKQGPFEGMEPGDVAAAFLHVLLMEFLGDPIIGPLILHVHSEWSRGMVEYHEQKAAEGLKVHSS